MSLAHYKKVADHHLLRLDDNEMPIETVVEAYVTSLYFASTTMTTVGYGDQSSGGTVAEELYACLMIFFSMSLFALVQNRMLNYKEQPTLETQWNEQESEMEMYLANIDRKLPKKKIPNHIYTQALEYMERSFRNSIKKVFHDDKKFFKLMPPRLKHKVFMACMKE